MYYMTTYLHLVEWSHCSAAPMASSSSSLDGPQKKKKRSNEREKFPDFSGAVRQMGDGEVSMSVEETNKMRLALGLKPLKVDAVQEKSRQEERLRRGRRDDERKEEENENGRAQKVTKTEKHDADALRDRLAAAREERLAASSRSCSREHRRSCNGCL